MKPWPEVLPGTLDVVYKRLEEGTLKVNFNTGRVYSYHKRKKKWKEVKRHLSGRKGYEYYSVTIFRCCVSYPRHWEKLVVYRRRKIRVHKLVWIAAHGKIPKGYLVHHKNRNRLHNGLLNLQLVTIEEHHNLHNGMNEVSNADEVW